MRHARSAGWVPLENRNIALSRMFSLQINNGEANGSRRGTLRVVPAATYFVQAVLGIGVGAVAILGVHVCQKAFGGRHRHS